MYAKPEKQHRKVVQTFKGLLSRMNAQRAVIEVMTAQLLITITVFHL